MKLLRNALFLVAAAVQCFGAAAPINVQKADGVNNLITGNLTVGDGRMINATGTGQIIATGSVPALPINLAAGGAGGVTGNLPVGNLNSGTSASSSTFWRGDEVWAAANPTSGSSILAGNGSGGFTNVTLGSGLSYSSPTLSLSNIPVTALNSGTAAGPTTFWRGDGSWATPAGGVGTVTSVGASVPSFLSVSGPITTAGTLAITYSGTALPIANGGTAATTAATARTNLGLEIGTNIQAWSANLDTWSGKTAYAGTVMVTTGKTFTSSNTLTLTGTDGSSLAIGNGGTLGTAAFQPTTAFEVPLTFSTGLTRTSNTITAGPMNLASTAAGGVTGNLPVARLNGGTLASSTTFWRGDGTWANPERQSDGNGIQAGNGTGGFYAITIGSNLTFAGGTLSATGGGGGGSPGGTPGQIQWNSAGNFAGFTTSGDATINTTTGALTLATVASAGTTGSSTAIPVVTINAKGLATSITTAAVVAPAGTLTGTTLASGVTASSLLSASGGSFGTAAFTAASAYEVPLTFSTGLTRTVNTVTVNASQSIATLSNLTTNGFVKTGGGVGTLSIDTNTYLTAAGAVTSITGTANQVIASASVGAVTLSTPQDIGTASTPQFGAIGIGAAVATSRLVAVNGAGPTTGITRFIIDAGTTLQSVTSTHRIFDSRPSIAAGSAAMGTLVHYAVGATGGNAGTIGAGSSVTTQYGFLFLPDYLATTNNYGFYSELVSGSGSYNLYFLGNAPNIIGGPVTLGVTGTFVGTLNFQNTTSGTATILPPTGALGTYNITLPNAASTLPIFGQQVTFTGPTAARSYALPDASSTIVTSSSVGVVTDTMLANAVKPAVALVATANLTLSGEQTIDGVLTSASLVLATGQSTGAQNGPWVTAAGAWARPAWYTSGSTTQAQQFLTTFVRLGTLYQGSTWRMTTAAVTIDTTTTAWVQTPMVLSATSVTNGVTGSGAAVLATSPTLVTPTLGTIASGNGAALTALTAANMTAGTFSGAFTTTSWVENTPVITGGLTASGSGANTFAGSTGTFLTSTGAVTIGPGAVGITGIATLTPPVRTSGVASYFTLNIPADTGQTASTESIGFKTVTATRTWADGTVTLQRENFFAGPTYNKTITSATFTDAFTLYATPPVAGTGVTFTRGHTLGIVDSTSAATSITGAVVISTTLGTTATSVSFGNGIGNFGGQIAVGGQMVAQGLVQSFSDVYCLNTAAFKFGTSRSFIYSPADGQIGVANSFGTGLTRLMLGVNTTSGPALAVDTVGSLAIQSGAGSATWNDSATANSGTVANRYVTGIAAPTFTSTGTSVTDTVASTLYIGGAPTASTNTTIGTAYALNVASGKTLLQALTMAVAQPLAFTSGTNQRAGDATLTAGTVTVNNTTVTANTRLFLTKKVDGGTLGSDITYSISAATSFTFGTGNVLDTSTYSYLLLEVP